MGEDWKTEMDFAEKLDRISNLVAEAMGCGHDDAENSVKALVADWKRLRDGKEDNALAVQLKAMRMRCEEWGISRADCARLSDAGIVEAFLARAVNGYFVVSLSKWALELGLVRGGCTERDAFNAIIDFLVETKRGSKIGRIGKELDYAGFTDGSELDRVKALIAERDQLRAELAQIGLVIAREKIGEAGR